MFNGHLDTVVPAKGKYPVVVALETGIHGVTPDGKLEKLSDYPENEIENNRFNDGKCDPAGRFWVGTMNKSVVKGAGNLYSYDSSEEFEILESIKTYMLDRIRPATVAIIEISTPFSAETI